MDLSLTDEQQLFRNSIREFLRRECPQEFLRALERKKTDHSPELYRKMADLGWMALPFPREYGGLGGGPIELAIFAEEMARAGCSIVAYFTTVILVGKSIGAFGTEEQKSFFLPRIIRGEIICALSLTEPDAGSDAASITTSADLDGDHLVINGTKMFTTNADIADYILIVARTERAASKYAGITMLLVDAKTAGITVRPIDTLGGYNTTEVVYEDVRVPRDSILGASGGGWFQLTHTLTDERIGISAGSVGLAQAAYDDALRYAKERRQFGKAIGKFQAIQHKLADLATEIHAARLMAYEVAWLSAQGLPCMKEASMAKLFCTQVAQKAAIAGMQIMGGYGYTMEHDMQRYLRRAMLGTIGGGTSEILRNIIAKMEGL